MRIGGNQASSGAKMHLKIHTQSDIYLRHIHQISQKPSRAL